MTSRLTPSRFSCEDDPSECLVAVSTSRRGERGDTSVFLLEGEGEESGVADPDALCAPVTLCGTCRFRFNCDAMFSSCFVRGAEVFAVLLFRVEGVHVSALFVEAPSSRRGERGDNTGIFECTARCWVLGRYTFSACFSRFRTQRSEFNGRLGEECLLGAVTLLFGLVPSRELTAEIPESAGRKGE